MSDQPDPRPRPPRRWRSSSRSTSPTSRAASPARSRRCCWSSTSRRARVARVGARAPGRRRRDRAGRARGGLAEQRRGFTLREVGGGWRLYSRHEYAPVVERFVLDGQQARLTQAALETLAVIAYRQPVSRSRVASIRGVNVDGVVRTLLTRGLIEEMGHDEETTAILYGTTLLLPGAARAQRLDDLPALAPCCPRSTCSTRSLKEAADDAGQEVRTPPGKKRGKPQRGSSGNTKPSQPTAAPQWPRRPAVDVHDPDGVRLQKVLAAAGVGSRRVCEDLIARAACRSTARSSPSSACGSTPARPSHVDGVRVQLDESRVYLAFNKPIGVVTTMSDELGRVDIGDFVANRKERLFHVGRLDADTEGLLLLTNDGDLAHRLQHPRTACPRPTSPRSPGRCRATSAAGCAQGIELDDGPVQVDSFRVVDSAPGKALVEVVLHEGRKHIVRRMLDAVGHPVLSLVRVQVGPIHLGDTQARQVAQDLVQRGGRGPLRRGRAVTRRPRRRHRAGGHQHRAGAARPRRRRHPRGHRPTAAALARDLGAGRLARRPASTPRSSSWPPRPDVTAGVVADALRPGRTPSSPTSRPSRSPCWTVCAPSAPTSRATSAPTRWPGASAPARSRRGRPVRRPQLGRLTPTDETDHRDRRAVDRRARLGAAPRDPDRPARPRRRRGGRLARAAAGREPGRRPARERPTARSPSPARGCATSPASRRATPSCGPRSSPATPRRCARCSPPCSPTSTASSAPSTTSAPPRRPGRPRHPGPRHGRRQRRPRPDPGQARRRADGLRDGARSSSPTSRGSSAGCSPTSAPAASTSRTSHLDHGVGAPVGLAELAVPAGRRGSLTDALEQRGWRVHS